MSDELGVEVLPCGCVLERKIEEGVRVLQVSPCRMGCPTLSEVEGMAAEWGKPIERRKA